MVIVMLSQILATDHWHVVFILCGFSHFSNVVKPTQVSVVDPVLMSFVVRYGVSEVRSCTVHFETRPCYRCFSCDRWFCEGCDRVHTCCGCGGSLCLECKPCALCEIMLEEYHELRDHPCSLRCECGRFLDLASWACEECKQLSCVAQPSDCARELVTNSCCGKDKCWHCSWWRVASGIGAPKIGYWCNHKVRICRTCPVPSNAVLRVQEFLSFS